MEKPRQMLPADEDATPVAAGEERTLVAPRFDDEETLVARPVVPLDAVEPDAAGAAPAPDYAASEPVHAQAAVYAQARRLPRRPTLLALMLVSVLVGGVLGGAGLYLYQRQLSDAHAPAAAASQPQAQDEQTNGAPQPAPEAVSPMPEAQPADSAANAPAAAAPDAAEGEGRAESDPERDGAAPERETQSVPAVGTPKRGKKGDRDEEIQRSTRRANGRDSAAPLSRAGAPEREARRVDTISYRPRRAARERARRQSAGDAERLRRIFEGTPEQ